MNRKSEMLARAGQQLINSGFYTESIHCWYYSVLQMMKYALANSTNRSLTYSNQESKGKQSVGFSHDWLKFEICNRITNSRIKNVFEEDFSVLKEERVSADYKLKVFSQIEAVTCRETSERMLAALRYII